MPIADKLQVIYDGVEDIRNALKEKDLSLGHGEIDTLGDDIRTLVPNFGYGVKVYGDVRSEEEIEIEDPDTHETTTKTEYTYTKSLILDSTLIATGGDLNTDVIDGIGELNGDMVDLPDGLLQIPLDTGVVLIVNPANIYVLFRDPIVENIVLTNWGTNGRITLEKVREITTLDIYFRSSDIESFNELKWFDGLSYTTSSGTNVRDDYFPFYNCTKLTSIKLPRVVSLGPGAFAGCTALGRIEIPNSFINLGDGHTESREYFKNTNIEELIIPDSVIQLSDYALSSMPSLKRIVWGENLPFPRTKSSVNYPIGYISNNPNLERIDNLPNSIAAGCITSFRNDEKLDFSEILPLITEAVDDSWDKNNSFLFQGTKIFDYAPNGIVTYPNITSNPNKYTGQNAFVNSSEGGYTINIPNWTENPNCFGDDRAGKIIFSDEVTTMDKFAQSSYVSEFILPCTTPPSLTYSTPLSSGQRVYVPASSLSAYQEHADWGSLAAKYIRAYRDPSNAMFCSIPASAPVPTDYTKVSYISNINGDALKNCQISNIGYIPKQYSQYLFDFSHKFIEAKSYSDEQACLFFTNDNNYKDFAITIYSSENDNWPTIYRQVGINDNYLNRMGMVNAQRWFFNSNITGECFGQRSVLKIAHKFMEYHGLVHQVDENTADSTQNLSLLRYNNNETIGRQIKIYRLCIFEPIANAADYDDPANYEIVRDYIPVMRNSDEVFGLYERLTDNFYSSTTSYPFSGPDYE